MNRLGILMLLLGLVVMPVAQAQDVTELPEQYEDDIFSLNYPDNWEIIEDDSIEGESIAFMVSANEGSSNAETQIVLSIIENDDDDPLERARDIPFDDRDNVVGLELEFKLNGLAGAYVDVIGDTTQRLFVLRVDDETLVDVVISGDTDDILALSATVYAVLNTLRLDDSEIDDLKFSYILSETHERRRDWSFKYPDGWSTDDYDNFTLLIIPGMETTLGVSYNAFPAGTETLGEYVDYLNDLFIESSGDIDYEDFPYEFEGIPAVLTRYDLQGDTSYLSLSANPREGRVTTISIFGPEEETEYFIAVAEAIILTIDDD